MNYKTLLLIFLVTSCTTFEFPDEKKETYPVINPATSRATPRDSVKSE